MPETFLFIASTVSGGTSLWATLRSKDNFFQWKLTRIYSLSVEGDFTLLPCRRPRQEIVDSSEPWDWLCSCWSVLPLLQVVVAAVLLDDASWCSRVLPMTTSDY